MQDDSKRYDIYDFRFNKPLGLRSCSCAATQHAYGNICIQATLRLCLLVKILCPPLFVSPVAYVNQSAPSSNLRLVQMHLVVLNSLLSLRLCRFIVALSCHVKFPFQFIPSGLICYYEPCLIFFFGIKLILCFDSFRCLVYLFIFDFFFGGRGGSSCPVTFHLDPVIMSPTSAHKSLTSTQFYCNVSKNIIFLQTGARALARLHFCGLASLVHCVWVFRTPCHVCLAGQRTKHIFLLHVPRLN